MNSKLNNSTSAQPTIQNSKLKTQNFCAYGRNSATSPNRKGPQVRKPSKCLNGRSYEKRLPKEAFRSPATRGLKKDSDRAITPAVEAVCAPAHLTPPGFPQAKQLHHLHAQLLLGQSCHKQKKSCFYVCRLLW